MAEEIDGRTKSNMNLRPFKPGQSGNPAGSSKAQRERALIRENCHLNNADLKDLYNLILRSDLNELMKVSKDPNTTVFKAMVASVAARAINKGDAASMEVLFNRFFGTVRQKVHHSGLENVAPPQVIITLPDNMRDKNQNESDSGT